MENMNENQPEQQQDADSTGSKQRRVVSGADLSNWRNLTQWEKEEAAKNFHQALMRGISEE